MVIQGNSFVRLARYVVSEGCGRFSSRAFLAFPANRARGGP